MTDDELLRALTTARAALEAGRHADAMEPLLAAWRLCRSEALATVIAALDARMPRLAVAGVPGSEAYEARWQRKLAAEGAPMVGRFAATLDRVERLEALLAFAPDPRLSAAVCQLLRDLRPAGHDVEATRALWLRAAEAVEVLDDPALVALRAVPHLWDGTHGVGGLALRLEVALTAIERRRPHGLDQLDAAATALVSGLHAALVEPAWARRRDDEQEALLARIYAAPADDGPRWVFADWLLERGDERGELIQLQLRRELDAAARARLEVLTRRAEKRWVGPLAPVLQKPVFRRGFVAEGWLVWAHRGQLEALGSHPAFATLERLRFTASPGVHLPQHLDPAVTPSLVRLEAVDDSGALMLARAERPWALTHLSLAIGSTEATRALSETERLPALVELSVVGQPTSWLWNARFRTQLRKLALAVSGRRAVWAAQREASRWPQLEALRITVFGLVIELARGPEHRFTEAVIHDHSTSGQRLIELLEMAPEHAFTALEIHTPLPDDRVQRLDDAAARQAGLDVYVIRRREIAP